MYENKSKQDLIKMLNLRNEKIEALENECSYLRKCLDEIDYNKIKIMIKELENGNAAVKESLRLLNEEKSELLENKIRIANMISNINKMIN